MLEDSVYIWLTFGKAHIKSTRGRSANESELWNYIPEEIQEQSIIVPSNEYHGDFNAELFDSLFKRIRNNLNDIGLGSCHTHLDGAASYHFHKPIKKPTTVSEVQDIKDWIVANGHDLPVEVKGSSPPKNELLEYLKNINYTLQFSIPKIAKDNGGHQVFKTTTPLRAPAH
ncbi:hypothetical protein BGZ51_008425 [Haplosporangium sp. Z 767]|nr:hypothetical protein BGZ51_008425 [Haplosporangium sp. Z 767]KAF9193750.1 hypothetical protein BGZ50_007160 [Haplosporangium sp. Z 11]